MTNSFFFLFKISLYYDDYYLNCKRKDSGFIGKDSVSTVRFMKQSVTPVSVPEVWWAPLDSKSKEKHFSSLVPIVLKEQIEWSPNPKPDLRCSLSSQ